MKLHDVLTEYSGQSVFYIANPGNGGDALIAAGAFKAFSKYNITLEKIISDTDSFDPTNKVIFYAGGGNLIDEYTASANFFEKSHFLAKRLILLPHTIKGHEALLKKFKSNVLLFARENKSFEFLQSLNLACDVAIDHDLALDLEPSYFSRYETDNTKKMYSKIFIKKLFGILSPISELNAFRRDVEKTRKKIPFDNLDVSQVVNYDPMMSNIKLINEAVADIFSLISRFDTVNTNRLHIAIAAGLLGKKVNFFPNSYWKNEALYEYSIQHKFKLVKFMLD